MSVAGKKVNLQVGDFWCEASVPFSDKDKIKQVRGVKWDKSNKIWIFPISSVNDFFHFFPWVSLEDNDKQRIKKYIKGQKNIQQLKNGEIEPAEHEFLMPHQRLCREIAKNTDRYCFYLDTGTGKTITALSIIADNLNIKWAVVCPLTIMGTAWIDDAKNFFPYLRILPMHDDYLKVKNLYKIARAWGLTLPNRLTKEKLVNILSRAAHVLLINPESVNRLKPTFETLRCEGLIFDESVLLKNNKAQITQLVLEMSKRYNKVYLLSGKPAPNNEMEYFSQMQIIDPSLFGNSFFHFRNTYFYPTDFNQYNWKIRTDIYDKFLSIIDRVSVTFLKEECLSLPEKTYEKRLIRLSGDAAKYYKDMERDRILSVDDWSVVAANKLSNIMKLRQITSGFIIDEEETKVLHTSKIKELLFVLESIGDKPVIIWANFKNEIRTIEAALKDNGKTVVTAYSETPNTNLSIDMFKAGEAQYIIAHPKTLKYGVTLTNCTYAVYYSMSYSYDDYYQSHDRIYRKGQTKPCTFIFLLCENTIDTIIYDAVQNKQELGKLLHERMLELKNGVDNN